MNSKDISACIAELDAAIEEKRTEIERAVARCNEIEGKTTRNSALKKRILTRYRLEIMALFEDLDAMNTKLWGLRDMGLPTSEI